MLFMVSAIYSHGQKELKFGHINTQELLSSLPASDSVKLQMEKFTKELEDQLDQMQVELNNKYQDYMSNRETYSKLVRETKETELQEMQQRIQNFQAKAEQDLQDKRVELFKPLYDKMNKAIEKVGKDNGFIYLFDVSPGVVLFHSEQSIDVMPLVKKELGVIK